MSLTEANLLTRVKTHIAANEATPTINDFDDASITEFADENTARVMEILAPTALPSETRMSQVAQHFPTLVAYDTALAFSSGSAALPATYFSALAVKVSTTTPTITKRYARLMFSPDEFARWDSSNFIYTPDMERPIVLAADTIRVKPTTITAGYIDYIKTHPTIASASTLFSPTGDDILVNLILADYYGFIEEPELMAVQLKLAEGYRGTK